MDDGESFNVLDVEADVQINTNVVMQSQQQQLQLQGWQTGICDCHKDNCKSYCLSVWFPCITFSRIADIVDKGSEGCCVHCCFYFLANCLGLCWMYAGWYRGKLRAEYRLQASPLPDRLAHCLCHSCALAQEYRELVARGFHVSKGWEGRPQAPPQLPARVPPGVQTPMKR